MYTHWLHFYCFNDTSHYGTGITHASTIYWSLFPEPVIRHDSGLSDACFLLLPTLKASSKYPLLHWLIILEIKWKSHIQYQLIQPVNTTWQSRENNLQISNNTTHQVNNTSKSQSPLVFCENVPLLTWLLPGISPLNLHMLVIHVPLPSQRLGGKCDFYRHLHSVLESNNKQIVNFGVFPLSSCYHIYEMRVHSSYAHICGTTERGIILTDCQLLCLWKLVLFVHDLELLVLAWRATSLTRYSLPSDILTSPAFAATFLTRQGILKYFLFWDKSLNWWSLKYSAYGFLVISYAFSLFRSRVQGLLGICWFLLAKFQIFFQNGITSSWLYYAPALKFIASKYLPLFSDSVCFISCT